MASSVSRDLKAVSRQLHAAPAACSLLAGVIEMQNVLPTLADTIAIHIGEQHRGTMRQGGKQVFGLRERA